jgi:hypothetical protein
MTGKDLVDERKKHEEEQEPDGSRKVTGRGRVDELIVQRGSSPPPTQVH